MSGGESRVKRSPWVMECNHNVILVFNEIESEARKSKFNGVRIKSLRDWRKITRRQFLMVIITFPVLVSSEPFTQNLFYKNKKDSRVTELCL